MSRIQEQSTAIPHKAIGAVVATGIMSFCGVIVETAMNITFPALMRHFGIGPSSVQWMTTLYLLVVASITPISAALKRRFRSRTLFLCANLLLPDRTGHRRAGSGLPAPAAGQGHTGAGHQNRPAADVQHHPPAGPDKAHRHHDGRRHPDYGHRTSRRSHLRRSGSNHHRLAFRLRHPDSHTAHLAGDRPGLHTLSFLCWQTGKRPG